MFFHYRSFLKVNNWKSFPVFLVLLCCWLYLMPQHVWAADYTVFGQAYAVTSKDAADQKILLADLKGMPLPFMRVSVFNRGTGELLGATDAGKNGQFTIKFTGPAGLNIDLRVYNTINGGSTQFPEAREGVNYIDSAGTYIQKKILVISDEFWEYGDKGFRNIPGVGMLFTRVGKVEIPYIKQNPVLPEAGLADFPSVVGVPGVADGVVRAAELGVKPFAKAPFGSKLLIFGDFGIPSITLCPFSKIDWYRVTITKHGTTESFILKDPLSKTKTVVQTVPVLKVTNSTENFGPFNGTAFGSVTVVDGLYRVNKNSVTPFSSIFYSFPDLRINWNTGSLNGLYEITVEYYQDKGGTPSNPIVQKINDTCFVATPPPGTLDGALHKLILRVNNQPLTVKYNHIYLKTAANKYFQGEGVSPADGPIGSAYDYNGAGLCDIITLKNKYQIEMHYTAHHAGGFMRNYSLSARSNSGSQTISFADQNFGALVTWFGTPDTGTSAVNPVPFSADCGYLFTLSGTSRIQNGYDYVQWAQPWRVFYVKPNL